ncbi:MAG: hypothetical protein IJ493_00650 [Clostridia bacterium]|nr:hypothetical protein [Clostridia bacterium]
MELIPIIFSTITGNAFKLAEAAAEVVPEHCGPYNIRYINDEVIERFDTFILTYWCDKGSADPDTIALIDKLHGKKLIVLGSLGVSRDTKHYEDVCRRVTELASRDNTLLGHFLCQGAIDLRRTGKKLREGKLSPERFEKQKLSQGHPDAQDLADARDAVRTFLEKT